MKHKIILTKRKIEALAAQYEINDPEQKEVFFQNLRNSKNREYDVFLSHATEDNDFVSRLLVFLKYAKGGIEGYVDWKDPLLPPVPDRQTAEQLTKRIEKARKFIYVATNQSLKSVWCSWELGYAERDKGTSGIAILAAKANNGRWNGNEYLQQFPWIAYDTGRGLFIVEYPNGETETLSTWLSIK